MGYKRKARPLCRFTVIGTDGWPRFSEPGVSMCAEHVRQLTWGHDCFWVRGWVDCSRSRRDRIDIPSGVGQVVLSATPEGSPAAVRRQVNVPLLLNRIGGSVVTPTASYNTAWGREAHPGLTSRHCDFLTCGRFDVSTLPVAGACLFGPRIPGTRGAGGDPRTMRGRGVTRRRNTAGQRCAGAK